MNISFTRSLCCRISAASLTLAALMVLGFSGPAKAGEQVPFRGRLEAVVTRGTVTPPFAPVLLEGVGNASKLGQFTFSAPHVVNITTRIATGTYEFTAANGDQVFAEFTGQATPTDTPGMLSIVEVATITGGTGRFANVTGSFTVERLYDSIEGTTVGSFSGSISSPGAGKR